MSRPLSTKDPDLVRAAFRPLIDLDIISWKGLPVITGETLRSVFGKPARTENAELGWYPAQRLRYAMNTASGGFDAYIRDNEVLLLETVNVPPASVLQDLGAPTAVMPHEILVEKAYVHEYLYCARGLVLSVAEPFNKEQPARIVRCRGISPINGPEQFGPELFMAFEDKTVW